MQTLQFKNNAFKWLLMFITGFALLSFASPTGGDVYEVYLNKKLVLQQFVGTGTAVKSIQLDRNNYSGEIDVVYNHCGTPGQDRQLKITDAKNKVLKEWHFGTGKDPKATMNIQVKDLLLAQKDNPVNKINIYYTSAQLPKGKLLTSIMLVDHNAAP